MNEIHIPIAEVHLETVFVDGNRIEYALLNPEGDVSPIRVRFSDLRNRLGDRFSEELHSQEIIARLAHHDEIKLVVRLNLDQSGPERWDVLVRIVNPIAQARGPELDLSNKRRSPRHPPERTTDIKLEVGSATIEGTLYNVSEHGLGIALLTDKSEAIRQFQVDQIVELVGEERIRGRIASQYPADGGCVLGIELKERFDYARLYAIEA
ncbi:MAG: hypothetical protein OXU20_14180 [Myxococcales bacterium]|nr:hypothetical protein [Myxococcales bacterium]MDD9965346.1 hypothetical protein [Myxococcales bacterium]